MDGERYLADLEKAWQPAQGMVFCGTCRYLGYGGGSLADCQHPNSQQRIVRQSNPQPWEKPAEEYVRIEYLLAKDRNAQNDCEDYARTGKVRQFCMRPGVEWLMDSFLGPVIAMILIGGFLGFLMALMRFLAAVL